MMDDHTPKPACFCVAGIFARWRISSRSCLHALRDAPQKQKFLGFSIFIFVVLCAWVYVALTAPPGNFPLGTVVTIPADTSLISVTNELRADHVISSPLIFRSAVILFGGEKSVVAGDYLLDKPDNVFALAVRFVRGSFHLQPVKVTVPEGWNVYQISDELGTRIPRFDTAGFLAYAKGDEGYLFPDTYFISPLATPQTVISTMRANFDTSTATLMPAIENFETTQHVSLADIITMASILEGEAKTTTDREIVAGILWKRLTLGMPLQVDSTFMYINGKNTYQLSAADLKIDSPYNTYIYAGLPPTPINNPGLDSITSAISPTATNNYLYFFSGRDGTMHYAVTYADHLKNIAKYGR